MAKQPKLTVKQTVSKYNSSKIKKIFAVIVLNFRRYMMLKLQIFIIIKILLGILRILKNIIIIRRKIKKQTIEKVESIPIKLVNKTAEKNLDHVIRRKLYVKGFIVKNRHVIGNHFAILNAIRMFYIIIKMMPKLIICRFKYLISKKQKKSNILQNLSKLDKVETINRYNMPNKQKYKKSNKHSKVQTNYKFKYDIAARYKIEDDLMQGLMNSKTVKKVDKVVYMFDFDTLYFINMLKLLIIKVQFKQDIFYNITSDVFKQHLSLLFTDGSISKYIQDVYFLFTSIARYFVLGGRRLARSRFIDLMLFYNAVLVNVSQNTEYGYNYFIYKDLNFNINNMIGEKLQKNVKIKAKSKNYGSNYIIKNNDNLLIKTFSQNITTFYNQQFSAFHKRTDHYKYVTEFYKSYYQLTEWLFTFKDNKDIVHNKLIYAGQIYYAYTTRKWQKAVLSYNYVGLQNKIYQGHLKAALLNVIKFRSLFSKFKNINYKIYNFNKNWHPYNSIYTIFNTLKYNNIHILTVYSIIYKIKNMYVMDLLNFSNFNVEKQQVLLQFFSIKKQWQHNNFMLGFSDLLSIVFSILIGYYYCLYNLYKFDHLQIDGNKGKLFYNLNKKLYIKNFDDYIILQKLWHKMFTFNTSQAFKYNNRAVRFIFLFNKQGMKIYQLLLIEFSKFSYYLVEIAEQQCCTNVFTTLLYVLKHTIIKSELTFLWHHLKNQLKKKTF